MQYLKISTYLAVINITLFALLASCTTSKLSNKNKGESVKANITNDANNLALNKLQPQQIPGFASRGSRGNEWAVPLVSVFGDLATEGFLKLIDNSRAKYTAQYKQTITNQYFYDRLSEVGPFDPSGIQFKGFEVVRFCEGNNKGTRDTAFYARFEIDTTNAYQILNNTAFRLVLKDLKVNYAKAKVPTAKWYAPWSWASSNNDKLNIDIEVVFKTSIRTPGDGFQNDIELGKCILPIRNLPLKTKKNTAAHKAFLDNMRGKMLAGSSFIIPRSYGFTVDDQDRNKLKPIYSMGSYSIEVSVKETGKEKFINQFTNIATGKVFEEEMKWFINDTNDKLKKR